LVQEVIDTIQATIDPPSWAGGVASVREMRGDLIVTQTARNHQELSDLLNKLSEANKMAVSIEARFISVSSGFLNVIGVDFDVYFNLGSTLNAPYVTDPFTGAQVPAGPASGWTGAGYNPSGGKYLTPIAASTSGGTRATSYGGRITDYSGTGVSNPIANSLSNPALSVSGIFLDDIQVDFLLEATQANQSSRTITAPRITVWNGQRAHVAVTTEQSYISGYETGGSSTVTIDGVTQTVTSSLPISATVPTGAMLDVEATITKDRKYVILTVQPWVSNLLSITNTVTAVGPIGLPLRSIQELKTTVIVPDGGTLLLGGTTVAGEVERELGVPLLSKIPILNRLTTNRGKSRDQQVLLILIRPKIIINEIEEAKQFPE
jgi:type II secretory pathway component GspD/PulD (secretin)